MGLDIQSLRLLLLAGQMGAKFDQTITLGRLDLLITPDQISEVGSQFGLQIDDREATDIIFSANRFSEPLLCRLGAKIVDSLDASGFEGATIIHDLNQRLPEELKEKYSLVFDGGTLEHVFNFPSAISACMELLRVGGHFIMVSPGNNHMGHGFYQFSPELFYRVFSPENGYRLKSLFLAPTYSEGQWYKVADPSSAGCRIGHNTSITPFSLYLIAERVEIVPIFSRPPQQSDYASEWSDAAGKRDCSRLHFFDEIMSARKKNSQLKAIARSLIPPIFRRWREAAMVARTTLTHPDPNHFIPEKMPGLHHGK